MPRARRQTDYETNESSDYMFINPIDGVSVCSYGRNTAGVSVWATMYDYDNYEMPIHDTEPENDIRTPKEFDKKETTHTIEIPPETIKRKVNIK